MAAESKTKHYVNVFLRYFVLILVGLIMIQCGDFLQHRFHPEEPDT